MRSSVRSGRGTATTALCLALLSPVVDAGNAFAQPTALDHQRHGVAVAVAKRPDVDAPAPARPPIPTGERVGDASAELPVAFAEKPGDSKSADATRLERALRALSDPDQSDGNNLYFLVLAVALYLACPLIAEHLKAGTKAEGGTKRNHDASMITLEEIGTDHVRNPPRRGESANAEESGNRIARG